MFYWPRTCAQTCSTASLADVALLSYDLWGCYAAAKTFIHGGRWELSIWVYNSNANVMLRTGTCLCNASCTIYWKRILIIIICFFFNYEITKFVLHGANSKWFVLGSEEDLISKVYPYRSLFKWYQLDQEPVQMAFNRWNWGLFELSLRHGFRTQSAETHSLLETLHVLFPIATCI